MILALEQKHKLKQAESDSSGGYKKGEQIYKQFIWKEDGPLFFAAGNGPVASADGGYADVSVSGDVLPTHHGHGKWPVEDQCIIGIIACWYK